MPRVTKKHHEEFDRRLTAFKIDYENALRDCKGLSELSLLSEDFRHQKQPESHHGR